MLAISLGSKCIKLLVEKLDFCWPYCESRGELIRPNDNILEIDKYQDYQVANGSG